MEMTLDEALKKGIEAHNAGQAQEADRFYTTILQSQPNHPDANHNMGLLAVGVGKTQEALPFLKKALEANPSIAQFWISYIDTLVKLDRTAQAKTAFDEAKRNGAEGEAFDTLEVMLNRNDEAGELAKVAPIMYQAIGHREAGEFLAAINLLTDSLNKFSNNAEFLSLLVQCYLGNNDLENAFLYLEKAKKIDPHNSSVGWNDARLNLKTNDFANALIIAKRTHENFPDDIEGIGVLGVCLRTSNEIDESMFYLDKAISLNPGYAEALIHRGLIKLARNDKLEALSDLETAHNLKPHIEQIWDLVISLKLEFQQYSEAIPILERIVKTEPNNAKNIAILAQCNQSLGNLDAAIDSYQKALEIKPDYVDVYNNMGVCLKGKNDLDAAINSYKLALQIKPDFADAYQNLGNALQDKGDLEAAIENYKQSLKLKPDNAEAYNNMGNALQDKGNLKAAIGSFKQALKVEPKYADAAWNLSGTSKTITESKNWLEQCLKADESHLNATLTLAALKFYEGDKSGFNDLVQSPLNDHSYMRSFAWVFNLPRLPELYFHRWALFDCIIEKSEKTRPFYEFGVWRGEAFRHLIKTFKKGYGFDTFEGIPEDWHDKKVGSYSSDGNIPTIAGGEFIVGKFEDTLATFFSEPRPMASVINFDADLYSSTILALNFSKPVIDNHTILIFDEFIINRNWEQDEYKALNEFCSNNNYTYEVIAISFFTKQVAVRLVSS